MRTKLKISLFSLIAFIVAALSFSTMIFAQGDTTCKGGISGTTLYDATNPNGGTTYFSELDENGTWFPTEVPLDIIGAGVGYAPASRFYAACADEDDDTFGSASVPQSVDFSDDEYIVRGWTWNDAIGFISMYCDGASGDGENEHIACGSYDYFVKIGKDGDGVPAGTRAITGYAWSAAYGYISMNGTAPVKTGLEEKQKVIGSGLVGSDFWGWSVDINDTGEYAIISGDGSSANTDATAQVFVRSGDTWSLQQELIPSDFAFGDGLGQSSAINAAGDYIILGAFADDDAGNKSGSAYIFTRSGTTWTEQDKLTASDAAAEDQFGWSVDISDAGDVAVIGSYLEETAPDKATGAVYAFTRSGTTWTEQQKLEANVELDNSSFGYDVAIDSSGDYIVVGVPYDNDNGGNAGAVYLFSESGGTWSQEDKYVGAVVGGDELGWDVGISDNGNKIIAAAVGDDTEENRAGAVYILSRSGGTLSQFQKLTISGAAAFDNFGDAVAITDNGEWLAIGAFGAGGTGANYTYSLSGATYVAEDTLIPAGSAYSGEKISISENGDWVVSGDSSDNGDTGAAHFFGPLITDIVWQVTMDSATGDVTGYGFSDAGVWLNFEGANIQLPGVPIEEGDWCDGKPWVCLEVSPDPTNLSFEDSDIGTEDGVRLADGVDSYIITLYLRERDGVTPLDASNYDMVNFFKSIEFHWTDTVKIEQFAGKIAEPELFKVDKPWQKGIGGITYKPVEEVTLGSFRQDPKGTGDNSRWELKFPITSYTPTTNANISLTSSSALVPFAVFNEDFPRGLTLDPIESNNLILERMVFELTEKASGDPVKDDDLDKVIFPNGRVGMSFKFRPLIELKDLYTGYLEDAIIALRSATVPFTAKLRALAELSNTTQESAELTMILTYAEEDTANACVLEPAEVTYFDFYFQEDLDGKIYDGMTPETRPTQFITKIYEKLGKSLYMAGIAEVPLKEDGRPCSYVMDPTLYSKIDYKIDAKDVGYYSNKLPRLTGVLANPAANIQGQVYAQVSYSPSEEVNIEGVDINIDTIRTTIDQNIKRILGDLTGLRGGGCQITDLTPLTISAPPGYECASSFYKNFSVGDEEVLYFKGSDVILNFDEWGTDVGEATDWVIIADDGNIYIDKDVYNETDNDQHLALLAFRRFKHSYASAGNIYLDCNVTNVQANIVVDGSLFSYCRDQYDANDLSFDTDWGEPMWNDFQHRVDSLQCQLLIEGNLSSKNTLGGGEITSEKKYFLMGTGLSSEEVSDRLNAQNYDLNYTRVFRLTIEYSPNGPIDQKCSKALSSSEIATIYDGGTVCGEKSGCDSDGAPDQATACDGITLQAYDDSTGFGDLVVPETGCLAQGLGENDFGPTYIRYVPPALDSFVFFKKGSSKIGN
ncbi:FG-GAP repeat protein [Patescibacteria group bacterium]